VVIKDIKQLCLKSIKQFVLSKSFSRWKIIERLLFIVKIFKILTTICVLRQSPIKRKNMLISFQQKIKKK